MRRNYFENVNCIEELKRQYFALAKKYHSDITGGSDEDMKALNAEYSDLFKVYKDKHASIKEDATEPYYEAKTATTEAPDEFINIIKFILGLKGVEVELCGTWLWLSGNTKDHKDVLKEMGCRYAPKKSEKKDVWSWHYDKDAVGFRRKKHTDMGYIRNVYGSVSYRTDEQLLLV